MSRDIKQEVIAQNRWLDVHRAVQYGEAKVVYHARIVQDPVAELAYRLCERWGTIAGLPDGEDSSGRQKIALMPVDELVKRSCDTAQALFAEFDKRGLLLAIPPLAPPSESEHNQ